MEIIGHQKQINFLLRLHKFKRVPHLFLFIGPEKVGKKTIAIEFSKLLLPKLSFSHPDFIFLTPEKDTISIEAVREAIFKISLKPMVGESKILVVDNAHCMTKEAQNSFLKTLEEPKGKTFIFLITHFPTQILPTIHSRAQKIKFNLVPKSEIEQYLLKKKIPPKEREFILKIAQGRPGVMLELLSNKNLLKDYEKLEKIIKELPQIPIYKRLEILEGISLKDELLRMFALNLENWLLDLNLRTKAISILRKMEIYFLAHYLFKVDKNTILDLLFLEF